MEKKRSAVLTIVMLSFIILIFTAADFLQADRLYSETENRVLASRPVFSPESLFSGRYAKDYETYATDQFVSRDKWIAVKTYTDICLQKKEINGVYLGAGGFLIEQHLPENYSAVQEAKKILLLQRLVRKWDAAVMLAPTADNILTDKLPPYAPYYDETRLLSRVEGQIGAEHCVDVYGVLKEHAAEEIYYRTDHHWTTLGAYYAYLAWAEATGRTPWDYDPSDMETAAEDFLGTLHSRVNFNMKGDRICYFPQTLSRPMQVTYDFQVKSDTCYEASHLDTKNKYGYFLDDNHAFVEIVTGYQDGGTLFVLKDSYANCFIPLLLPHYERIYVMDLRYFNGRLFDFMEKYEPEEGMDVLVLYNCIHFLEEFAFAE